MNSDIKIDFIPLASEHIPLLRQWLKEPHVAEFWQEPDDEAEFRDKFLRKLKERSVKPFVIQVDGKPIGYIQSYEANKVGGGWWPNEKPGVHGIDQFIGDPSLVGRGLGTLVIDKFLQKLFSDLSVMEVITDPDPKNGRAIRAYEKVGFLKEGKITTPGEKALLLRISRYSFTGRAAASLDLSDTVREFQKVAGGYRGFWCVAGGWAIDLFLGKKSRDHEDLEIVVLREESGAMYDHFRKFSPNKIISGDPPEFVAWDGRAIENEVIQLRLAPVSMGSGIVDFDLLLTPSENGQWICRRDESVRLPLEEARGLTKDGIPFLAPEIVLLFKAKRVEEKDQRDFELTAPLLSPKAKRWLAGNLSRIYPGHKWLLASSLNT